MWVPPPPSAGRWCVIPAGPAWGLKSVVAAPRLPHRTNRPKRCTCLLLIRSRTWEWSVSNEDNRTDVALTKSEQELRLLVDTIPALVWAAGPEGDIEYVNKRVLDYLGTTLDEITRNGWLEKVHPDDVAFKTTTWLANLESRTADDAFCRFRGADGQYRWFAVSGAPLKVGDGRVLRWYGVLIDIDERKKAEEALRESEYKLHQIIDTVAGITWSTGSDDPEGKKAEVQPRF